MTTYKITVRKNIRSPKYGFGINRTSHGKRFDVPYFSIASFNPVDNKTIRFKRSGLRMIFENNRTGTTRVYHLVGNRNGTRKTKAA